MNNLFNYLSELENMFNNFDINEILNNDDNKVNLDFTKKEDVEKLEKAVKLLKENEFFGSLFDANFLDEILEKAKEIYNNANKKEGPIRPSLKTPEKIQNNIKKLASEYVTTLIEPNIKDINELTKNEIIDSLFEFACWIFNKNNA